MTINLIKANPEDSIPSFSVDLTKINQPKELSKGQKIQQVAFIPLKLIGDVFNSLASAGWLTLKNSGISFKYLVLEGNSVKLRNLINIKFTAFKIIFWLGSLGWCFGATAWRSLMEKYGRPLNSLVKEAASSEIDLGHLRTKNLIIDTKGIPSHVKVQDLLTEFDAIDFTHPHSPYYIKYDATTGSSVEKLRENLETFCQNISGRVPFCGTPPAHDISRLLVFYQQIEDAVRFSLHKVSSELAQFKKDHPEPYDSMSPELQNEFKNLCENKGRVVLDLAIAGGHCGARYMSESTNIYFHLKGEGNGGALTLQEELFELLAEERAQIANRHALNKGTDNEGTDAHIYSRYMNTMGSLLALPGTHGVVEHLNKTFNLEKNLNDFFQEYTVDRILALTQAKVKKSQAFREQINDWIRDQAGEWNRSYYQSEAAGKLAEIESLLRDEKWDKMNPHAELITKIQSKLFMSEEVLKRILNGSLSLKEAIHNHFELERKNQFLFEVLSTDDPYTPWDMTANGLSKELMEWLLVSQGILKPQKNKLLINTPIALTDRKKDRFIDTITSKTSKALQDQGVEDWISKRHADERNTRFMASHILSFYPSPSKERYRFSLTPEDNLLNVIFKSAFKNNPEAIIKIAQETDPSLVYPQWKKVCWIQCPEIASQVFRNPLIQLFASYMMFSYAYKVAGLIYTGLDSTLNVSNLRHVVSLVSNNMPPQLLSAIDKVINAAEFIYANKGVLAFRAFCVNIIAHFSPNIPYVTPAIKFVSLKVYNVAMGLWTSSFSWGLYTFSAALKVATFPIQVCNAVADHLKAIATEAKKVRLKAEKRHARAVWTNALA